MVEVLVCVCVWCLLALQYFLWIGVHGVGETEACSKSDSSTCLHLDGLDADFFHQVSTTCLLDPGQSSSLAPMIPSGDR